MMIKNFYMMSLLTLVSYSLSAAQQENQVADWEPDVAIIEFDAVGTPHIGQRDNHEVCSAPRKRRSYGMDHAKLATVRKVLFADEILEQEPRPAAPVRTLAPNRSALLFVSVRNQVRSVTPDQNDENSQP